MNFVRIDGAFVNLDQVTQIKFSYAGEHPASAAIYLQATDETEPGPIHAGKESASALLTFLRDNSVDLRNMKEYEAQKQIARTERVKNQMLGR